MDPGVIIGLFGSAIAALFAAYSLNIRQQIATADKHAETWKEFYVKECEKHDRTRADSADDLRELTGAVRDLTEVVRQVPKRRDDWTSEPARRDHAR